MRPVHSSAIILLCMFGITASADTGAGSGGERQGGTQHYAIAAATTADLQTDNQPERAPVAAAGMLSVPELTALPNPVYNRNEKVVLTYQTRMAGTALVNIYDAVGSMVFETTVELRRPDAVGYKVSIPWDCRNRMGRFVGNGTYLGVIRIFNIDDQPVARHTVRIGIAY